jgi:DNA-binding GntR family transcriptional regulator
MDTSKEQTMTRLNLPQVDGRSRRHQVLEALREAIASGSLHPGDRLTEADIAQQMGVSRAPVREALRQLEQEGLVVSYPYRGTEVLGVSREEVEEVLVPIRLTLERFAFRHALPNLTSQDDSRLGQIVEAMRRAAEAGDLYALANNDVEFHELIIERSGQQHCAQIWRSISSRVRVSFLYGAPAHASVFDVVEEHEVLLAALRTRDAATVVPVLEEHITNMARFTQDTTARTS